jgi:hypothetical protein
MSQEQRGNTMSRYSSEERARIIDETRATLQRGEAGDQRQNEQEYLADMRAEEDAALVAAAPVNDPMTEWRNFHSEQERQFARSRRAEQRRSAAPAPDLALQISSAIADEREFQREILAHVIVELDERRENAIADAVRPLLGEVAQLKAAIAEQRVSICELQLSDGKLRQELAGDRSKIVDLPPLPLRSRAN